VTTRDPELVRLLTQELLRHLPSVEATDLEGARRAVHALKGSAGLSGELELAAALQRLERRLQGGDKTAIVDAGAVVKLAIARLDAGLPGVAAEWPSPPEDLAPVSLDPLVRTQYVAELADRLARIDQALGLKGDADEAVHDIYRHVHTIKGAASAVGDEPMSWFCHGLEEWLKAGTGGSEAASAALVEVAKWRSVLGGLLDEPETTLGTLRGGRARPRASSIPAAPASRSSAPEDGPRSVVIEEATIRVDAQSVDRVLERIAQVGLVQEQIASSGERAKLEARELRRLRAELSEALRLIGPPRPWGAPAAALRKIERAGASLSALGESVESQANEMRARGQSLKGAMREARQHLSAMRQASLKRMFARLATAVESEARRAERIIVVRTHGADETIDRRVADSLVEACMTLARNAVAHGVEAPGVRERLGKPPVGTITLSARKTASRLLLTIADDGAGVDVDAIRRRAVETGAVTDAIAEAADDNTLLALLFLPGFSTRESTDLLAGRGIGLEIAQIQVQRLGGVIRLSSRHGLGFEARVEVPIETGITHVLWVTAAGVEHAIAATNLRRVRANDGADAERVPHLAACLEARPNERATYALDVALDDGEDGAPAQITIGVDAVGQTEEVLVRPLTPLVSALGPFAGAIVRGDGSLRLALDVHALAPRARALGRVPEGRTSDFPQSRPPPSRPSSDSP
jgi:two-component system, chemotaxis family, sensor kinase CheA